MTWGRRLLLINNDDVRALLTARDCIDILEQAFAEVATGRSVQRPRIDVYAPAERADGYFRWSSMDGATVKPGPYFATRIKSDIVYWPESSAGHIVEKKFCFSEGLYCGLVMLFSTQDARPLAMINDGVLQLLRVGAGAAIGAKYLARQDARVMAVLGSGGMARSYLEAIVSVRDIRKVKVYSPTAANRSKYAAEMSEKLNLEVEPVETARLAVAGVDIVACCTDTMTPVLAPEWLEPGMHVTNVSPAEIDSACQKKFDVIFRQGEAGINIAPPHSGRVLREAGLSPIAYVAGTDEDVRRLPKPPETRTGFGGAFPSIVELITGQSQGRASQEQITFYHNFGNQGIQFAAVGGLVYEAACARGRGRTLPDEWFLQDVRN